MSQIVDIAECNRSEEETQSTVSLSESLLPPGGTSGTDDGVVPVTWSPAVLALKQRTGYPLRQENGQRRYGPPPDWIGPAPGRGSEVFVGKLPRDCFEDELVPIFERFGKIYEMRLMMDFSGSTRGYCFVTFSTRHEAQRAIQEGDNLELRPGKCIGVCPSVDNCRLFVGGLPRHRRREEILVEMRKLAEGVRDVIVYPDARDKQRNRGFAFVEFSSHSDAAKARRNLISAGVQLWGQTLAIDWAEPEAEPDDDVMNKVKILYVRNLMLDTTEETIERLFTDAVVRANEKRAPGVSQTDQPIIERVKKIRDYAFVHFREREDAILAMNRMNGSDIDGSTIEVVLAKPADKSKQRQSRNKSAADVAQIPGIPIFAAVGGSLVPAQMAAMPTANSVLLAAANGSRELHQTNRTQTASLKSRSAIGTTVTSSYRSNFMPYKKPSTASENRLCSYLMPTVEVIYANPPMLIQPPVLPSSVQMLEEMCVQSGYGQPVYQLFTGVNEGVQMYTCKLTAAGKEFIVNTMSHTAEEAQTNVAMIALKSLTEVTPVANIPPSVVSQPVSWASSAVVAPGQVYACSMSPAAALTAPVQMPVAHVRGSNPAAVTPYHYLTAAGMSSMPSGNALYAATDFSGASPASMMVGQTATYLPTLATYNI